MGLRRSLGRADRDAARARRCGLSYDGLLARLMGRLTRGITNRYLDMEAGGLKRRSEENARAASSVRLEPVAGVGERVGDGGR